ncbi:MAG: hypothetical protein WA902_10145 [Thermosynechococcaceae cyanobacterium]
MSPSSCVAATLSPAERQELALQVLTKAEPITTLAHKQQVSRKFLYEQSNKANDALASAFATSNNDNDVLFNLPVTKAWLFQLILSLVLICHSSFRGVVELLRDLFDFPTSVGTIHNRLETASSAAAKVNQSQDLSAVGVGLHDEIFHGSKPVLVGIDAASTYCYLLEAADHRDADTWGYHLLNAAEQGLDPDYTIADAGAGLRAGQKEALGDKPCHGDVFHIQHQCQTLANSLTRKAMGATSRRQELEAKMAEAKEQGQWNHLSVPLGKARLQEKQALQLARDTKTLIEWLHHDVLQLAGPDHAERVELYDFIVTELQQREELGGKQMRVLRKALKNQRDDLLAFAKIFDDKLAEISQRFDVPMFLVRQMVRFFRKQPTSEAYWRTWGDLHETMGWKFFQLCSISGTSAPK